MVQHILNGTCSDGACFIKSFRVRAWCHKDGLGYFPGACLVPVTGADSAGGCHVPPRSNLAWLGAAARKAGALLHCFGLGGDWGPIGRGSSTTSAGAGSRSASLPPLASPLITTDPSSGSRFELSFF
jgi:hypothetical protein